MRPYSGFGFEVELPLAGFFLFLAAFWRGSDEEPDGAVSFCESCAIRPFRHIRAERGPLLAVLVTKTPRDQASGQGITLSRRCITFRQ